MDFEALFGTRPTVTATAPGRVNLIGEHTDYNDGFVLPAALPLETTVEFAARANTTTRVWSADYPDEQPQNFLLDHLERAHNWTDYVRGMAWVLLDHGLRQGFDARISSQVPVGSGLSSSAALLIAVGRAIRTAFQLPIDDLLLARLARKAETDFVGAPVGIMDQMACSLADESRALHRYANTCLRAHPAAANGDAAGDRLGSSAQPRHRRVSRAAGRVRTRRRCARCCQLA